MVKIAPSLLAADFSRLGEEVRRAESGDALHIDVMDGVFVPNLSMGPQVVKALRGLSALPFDVHLMLGDPLPYVKIFREAGADWLSFHIECAADPEAVLSAIEGSGALPGIALKPATDPRVLLPFSERLRLITVMTVEPGFGGQKLMPEALKKIPWLKERFPQAMIEVDGGVNRETAALVRQAGADVLVAGTAVFRAEDPAAAVRALRGE